MNDNEKLTQEVRKLRKENKRLREAVTAWRAADKAFGEMITATEDEKVDINSYARWLDLLWHARGLRPPIDEITL